MLWIKSLNLCLLSIIKLNKYAQYANKNFKLPILNKKKKPNQTKRKKTPKMHLRTLNCTKPCSRSIACCYTLCPLDGDVSPCSTAIKSRLFFFSCNHLTLRQLMHCACTRTQKTSTKGFQELRPDVRFSSHIFGFVLTVISPIIFIFLLPHFSRHYRRWRYIFVF